MAVEVIGQSRRLVVRIRGSYWWSASFRLALFPLKNLGQKSDVVGAVFIAPWRLSTSWNSVVALLSSWSVVSDMNGLHFFTVETTGQENEHLNRLCCAFSTLARTTCASTARLWANHTEGKKAISSCTTPVTCCCFFKQDRQRVPSCSVFLFPFVSKIFVCGMRIRSLAEKHCRGWL